MPLFVLLELIRSNRIATGSSGQCIRDPILEIYPAVWRRGSESWTGVETTPDSVPASAFIIGLAEFILCFNKH
jgi:hypothetical protein